jgi:IrrE N-terminal-like domain
MTTYDIKSGLRLALTKLEKSLHSPDGLLPSPTDEIMRSEERMAARLVARLQLSPPVDVEALCSRFADVKSKQFPIDVDGICLDLKVIGKRPKVWISTHLHPVRRRFTLAHEIGHIMIPWHTGSIVDELDAPQSSAHGKYREMEAEANRFAAELLMPSAWVSGLSERTNHLADLLLSVVEIADVSYPAAFLRSLKFGKPGFVGAEVREGVVVRSKRTVGTYSLPPEEGGCVDELDMPAAHPPRIVQGPDTKYFIWEMRDVLPDPGIDLPQWREILDAILLDIPTEYRQSARASVNAIIGSAIGKEQKGAPVERIFKRGMEAIQNRPSNNPWMQEVISDDRFRAYVLARARERSSVA